MAEKRPQFKHPQLRKKSTYLRIISRTMHILKICTKNLEKFRLYQSEFAKLCALHALVPTCFTHHCHAPYQSLIRALCAYTSLASSIGTLWPLPFAVFLQLKGIVRLFCTPINHSPYVFLLSFILPCKAGLLTFFPFFCFKPFVTPLLHVWSYLLVCWKKDCISNTGNVFAFVFSEVKKTKKSKSKWRKWGIGSLK